MFLENWISIFLRLEAIEKEEDLIISDESNLHHTKFNQSHHNDGEETDKTKPKYKMFENFPIVNNPEATGMLIY